MPKLYEGYNIGTWEYKFRKELQPLADMRKDLIDTFKPYKATSFYLKRDLKQPYFGLKHLVNGSLTLIGSVPYFLMQNLFSLGSVLTPPVFKHRLKYNLDELGLNLTRGIVQIIRGSTQIITTPLAFFLRIPSRLSQTLVLGNPPLEDNPGLKRKLAEGEHILEGSKFSQIEAQQLTRIMGKLYNKSSKALDRGQLSRGHLNNDQILKELAIEKITVGDPILAKETARGFFGLFYPKYKVSVDFMPRSPRGSDHLQLPHAHHSPRSPHPKSPGSRSRH